MTVEAVATPLAQIGEPFPFVGIDAIADDDVDVDDVLRSVDDLLDEFTNAPRVTAALADPEMQKHYDQFSVALLPLIELLPGGTPDDRAINALAFAQRIAFSSRVHGYRDAVPSAILAAAYARCMYELAPAYIGDRDDQVERDRAVKFFIYAVISMTVNFQIPAWVTELAA